MTALSVMVGATLSTAGLSPVLICSTVLAWMAVAVVLASVVTVVAGQARPRVREHGARASWTRCMPLQACTVCAR